MEACFLDKLPQILLCQKLISPGGFIMLKTYDVIVGWDIGGVQSKCASISGDFAFLSSKDMTFEIWKDPGKLSTVLEYLASDIPLSDTAMAITMTAELSDCFTTKAEGVRFVLEAFIDTFPGIPTYVPWHERKVGASRKSYGRSDQLCGNELDSGRS